MKILLAEDNLVNQKTIMRLLTSFFPSESNEIIIVDKAEDAVSAFRREHFDLIIMDGNLKGELKGWDAADQIRLIEITEKSSEKPVIIFAWSTETREPGGTILKEFPAADGRLPKPITKEGLKDLLEKYHFIEPSAEKIKIPSPLQSSPIHSASKTTSSTPREDEEEKGIDIKP